MIARVINTSMGLDRPRWKVVWTNKINEISESEMNVQNIQRLSQAPEAAKGTAMTNARNCALNQYRLVNLFLRAVRNSGMATTKRKIDIVIKNPVLKIVRLSICISGFVIF